MNNLRLPAIRIEQSPGRTLYSFAVNGKLIPNFAAVSRVKRNDTRQILGYQRPEILSHIEEIQRYLESSSPMIPNAIVVALDERVQFQPAPEADQSSNAVAGVLSIPWDESMEEAEKPGWIVDGQQRVAAVRDARIDGFPMFVTAFVAKSDTEQREQFILVNSTKPLPKGLVYELLPATTGQLSRQLQRRRFPAYLLSRLNQDSDSPIRGMVRTPTNGEGVIKDNSLLKMLENSLSDGALYRFRGKSDEENDAESMLALLRGFWSAVSHIFPTAWGLPPRRSRLMHGAGIVSLGFVMDAIADLHRHEVEITDEHFYTSLEPLLPICRWTDGYWDFGPGMQIKWNELQNTSRHIQILSNYLLIQYRENSWAKREQATPSGT